MRIKLFAAIPLFILSCVTPSDDDSQMAFISLDDSLIAVGLKDGKEINSSAFVDGISASLILGDTQFNHGFKGDTSFRPKGVNIRAKRYRDNDGWYTYFYQFNFNDTNEQAAFESFTPYSQVYLNNNKLSASYFWHQNHLFLKCIIP